MQWGGAEQREVCGSYHAFVERDVVEEGRTCPRAKAGPVNAPEPTIPAASATPVNTQGFTIFSAEGLCKQMWPRSRFDVLCVSTLRAKGRRRGKDKFFVKRRFVEVHPGPGSEEICDCNKRPRRWIAERGERWLGRYMINLVGHFGVCHGHSRRK